MIYQILLYSALIVFCLVMALITWAGLHSSFRKRNKVDSYTANAVNALGISTNRVQTSKTWTIKAPCIEWRDVWMGCYWNKTQNEETNTDLLDIYVCIIPCVVIKLLRVTCYTIVPRADRRIDPLCYACGLPHSAHPVTDDGIPCAGQFIL